MESTCRREKCWLWKKSKEDCPFRVVTFWKKEGSSSEIKIEDCAPVRNTLQLQTLQQLVLGLMKASNQERNKSHESIGVLMEVLRNVTITREIDPSKPLPLPSIPEGRGS